jgi:hypothetical protein
VKLRAEHDSNSRVAVPVTRTTTWFHASGVRDNSHTVTTRGDTGDRWLAVDSSSPKAAAATAARAIAIRVPGFRIIDQGFAIHDQGFRIHDQGFRIHDQGFRIHDQGFRIHDQGFRIHDQGFGIRDQGFGISDQGSGIHNVVSGAP